MKERITNVLVIAVIVAYLFVHFGLSFIFTCLSTATYIAGTKVEAVVTASNVSRPVGDDADEIGATAVYADADGHTHRLFVEGGAKSLNQHVAVAYLPFYPAYGIVLADYERVFPVTVVGFAFSFGVFYLSWRFLLKPFFRKGKSDEIHGPIVESTSPSTVPPP